ncbi:hypothetical protein BH11PSE10_BH11PSE10_17300 [soil metagenome]
MRDGAAINASAAAASELARLQTQVEAARAVLVRLLQDTVEAEVRLGSNQAVQLLEANERLLMSALHNQHEAETATHALDEATRSAELDGLTHLPNRWLMFDRFRHAMAKGRRHSERLAVLFLDIDKFKSINDDLGHAVGDEVLKTIAQRMQSSVREEDTVSRYGGDEFVILLTHINQVTDAIHAAEKVIAALAAPSTVAGQEQGFSASIGISFYPDDGDDAEVLIDLADRAMYGAKKLGGGTYALHGDLLRRNIPPLASVCVVSQMPNTFEQRNALLREANEKLVVAALSAHDLLAAAEHAQQRQTAFMDVVAQELRNPNAPIRIAGSVLGLGSVAEPLLPRMQEVIDAQWQRMTRLLDDVVQMSRAQAGRLNLALRSLDLSHLLREAIASARPLMALRNQQLRLVLPIKPIPVLADAERLSQVFSNLLDNASKYTPDGGEVSVSALIAGSGETVIITVADNGIGLAADALATVFEPFAQDSRALGFQGFSGTGVGMGLGLTVVRELVQAHGGSVAASSAGPGKGSEITVTLPLPLPLPLQLRE